MRQHPAARCRLFPIPGCTPYPARTEAQSAAHDDTFGKDGGGDRRRGHLGLAVVRNLLEDGAQVALVDVDAMRLDSLIRFLRGTVVAVACDVSEPGACARRTSGSRRSWAPWTSW
jgi:hypothetical protein